MASEPGENEIVSLKGRMMWTCGKCNSFFNLRFWIKTFFFLFAWWKIITSTYSNEVDFFFLPTACCTVDECTERSLGSNTQYKWNYTLIRCIFHTSIHTTVTTVLLISWRNVLVRSTRKTTHQLIENKTAENISVKVQLLIQVKIKMEKSCVSWTCHMVQIRRWSESSVPFLL